MKNERLLELLENVKLLDSNGVSRLVEQIKKTFAPLIHQHSKVDVGLSNVDNTPDNEKIVKHSSTTDALKQPVKIGNASFDGHTNVTLQEMGIVNPIEITKEEYQKLKESGQLDMEAYYNIIDDFDSVGLINDTTPFSNQVFSSVKTEATYAKKASVIDTQLLSSSWKGTQSPYTYELSVNGVTSTNINEINFKFNATQAQLESYQNALLQDGGQTENRIILKAMGDKPSVDIPVTIIVRHDT